MFNAIEEMLPAEWRGAFHVLATPLRWIPDWHSALIGFAWYGDTALESVLKRVVILLPSLLLVAGMWSTMISLYSLPFRSGRSGFLTSLLMSWWDAGRCTWLFWAGMVRVSVSLAGWLWGFLRLGARILKNAVVALFQSPLTLIDWTSRKYFQPGVPWIAFLVLLLWSSVEATIFTFTLQPTLSEVLAGLTGFEPNPAVMAPMLWIFLFLLISGSFACIQVLADAVHKKRVGEIIQMLLVECFVMFFEVIFLYRELIDAVTPWIAQTSGGQIQLGLTATVALASFGWMGVRGMTWFLFGRFGTPALLAILSRQTIAHDGAHANIAEPVRPDLWRGPVAALKAESAWFKNEARELFELMSLPVLQLLAVAVNFAVVTLQSRPVFLLPFKNLDEMLAATPFMRREPVPERGAHRTGGAPIASQHLPSGATT